MTALQKLVKKFFLRWDPKVAIVLANKLEEIELHGLAASLRQRVDDDLLRQQSLFQSTAARVEDLGHLMGMRSFFSKDFTIETWLNPKLPKIVKKKNLCGFEWHAHNCRRQQREYVKPDKLFAPRRVCTLPKNHKGDHVHDPKLGLKRKSGIPMPKEAA